MQRQNDHEQDKVSETLSMLEAGLISLKTADLLEFLHVYSSSLQQLSGRSRLQVRGEQPAWYKLTEKKATVTRITALYSRGEPQSISETGYDDDDRYPRISIFTDYQYIQTLNATRVP